MRQSSDVIVSDHIRHTLSLQLVNKELETNPLLKKKNYKIIFNLVCFQRAESEFMVK